MCKTIVIMLTLLIHFYNCTYFPYLRFVKPDGIPCFLHQAYSHYAFAFYCIILYYTYVVILLSILLNHIYGLLLSCHMYYTNGLGFRLLVYYSQYAIYLIYMTQVQFSVLASLSFDLKYFFDLCI